MIFSTLEVEFFLRLSLVFWPILAFLLSWGLEIRFFGTYFSLFKPLRSLLIDLDFLPWSFLLASLR